MMKLGAASAYFNKTTFQDAYSPRWTVRGRLLAQDDNTRDSLSTERRALAVNPSTPIPQRRVLAVGRQAWIVGNQSNDYHGDEALHEHYTVHRADGLVKVLTFEEALSISEGQSIYAGKVWVKDQRESEESSLQYPQYQFYLSSTENIIDATRIDYEGSETNVLITTGGRWYLVRNIIFTAAGFQMALTDELPQPVLSPADFLIKTYDRVKDKNTEVAKRVNAMVVRWQSSYVYPTVYSTKYEAGDRQLVVLKSDITPQAGDSVKLGERKFKVASKVEQGNLWFVHLSPA